MSNWARDLHVGLIDSALPKKKARVEPITFTDEDLLTNPYHNAEALVVIIDIMGVDVQRVMVDTCSNVNVLYMEVFK